MHIAKALGFQIVIILPLSIPKTVFNTPALLCHFQEFGDLARVS
jgi:hypothetical protein